MFKLNFSIYFSIYHHHDDINLTLSAIKMTFIQKSVKNIHHPMSIVLSEQYSQHMSSNLKLP